MNHAAISPAANLSLRVWRALPQFGRIFAAHTTLIPLAAALIGLLLVLYATRWGIGASPDSTGYLEGARNLVSGHGFSSAKAGSIEPITHWPPFYSMTLAALGLLGIDAVVGARILGTFLFGANILLVGFVLWKTSGPAAAWLGSLIMVSSLDMLLLHTMAMTEPLFLFAAVLGLYLLTRYLERPTASTLIAASVVIGLAFLTRYLGLALIGAGVLSILLLTRQAWWRRVVHSVSFLLISVAPMLIWILSNLSTDRAVGERSFTFHPPAMEQLKYALLTVAAWVIPLSVPVRIRVLLFAAVGVALLFLLTTRGQPRRLVSILRRSSLLLVSAIFVAIYLAMLLTSITLFDAHTPLNARLLSPVYLIGVLALSIALPALYAHAVPRSRRLLGLAVAVFLLTSFVQSATWAFAAHQEGIGYTSRAWRESQIVEIVRTLPSGTPIYSNADDALYFHTGETTLSIPWKWDPFTRRANPDYRVELASMLDQLREKEGVIVFSALIAWRDYLPTQDELERECAFELVYRGEEGAVYRVPKAQGCSGGSLGHRQTAGCGARSLAATTITAAPCFN